MNGSRTRIIAICMLCGALGAGGMFGCGGTDQPVATPLRFAPRPANSLATDYAPAAAPADRPSGGSASAEPALGTADPAPMSASTPRSGALPVAQSAAGRGAMPAAEIPSAPATAAGPSAGALTVRFTTVNQGTRYSPQNVGAVWIEDAAGAFVKTLERWASSRARYLKRWTAASGGWPAGRGAAANPDQMDAVSRATLRTEQKHEMTWDMHDTKGGLVPNGTYHVVIEVTEINGTGPNDIIPFEKGPMPLQLMPPDKTPYATMSVQYQP